MAASEKWDQMWGGGAQDPQFFVVRFAICLVLNLCSRIS